ncbi:hypothetical protein QR680_007159 [Steinernema hermaphroditum]|uniref:7TM GPCR serpentine receptor class x (Srx) domain-containing protein n=1 Tax=Steinernema hermaphroditum TaxID=289476 RepID=A0AA39HXT9_9BILA|nr:hypothetical protein QR680_007159 [Steinernema hermaphroditum]
MTVEYSVDADTSLLNESMSYTYMDNQTEDVYDDIEHQHPLAAALILGLLDLSGVIVHAYILYRVMFKKVFGRLFGWMWISRELGLVISGLLDGGVRAPSFALYPDIYDTKEGRFLAQVMVVLLIQTLASNLLIASNRCLLIRKPLSFKSVFTPKKTAYMIALVWIVPIVLFASISFLPFCDDFDIDGEVIPLCFLIEILLSFLFAYGAIILTFVIDMYAIWRLRHMSKIRSEVLSNQLSPRSKRKQLNLCYMIILQSLVAVPTSFLEIVYDSIFWNITITLDGLIVIYFNDDLRPWKKIHPSLHRDSNGNLHRINSKGSICTTIID